MTPRTIVVGGGVIGAATAYYLARAGREVTILEKGSFGAACSRGNCGYVCPSHALPLAAPGVLWPTLKTLFQRNSPFKIRARIDPHLWTWLLNFARRCNRDTMLADARALHAILQSSRSLYDELIAAENLACEWEQRGLLFVYQTQRGLEHYAATDRLLREEFNLGAERYDGAGLARLEPAIKPEIAGAWHYTGDAHLRPERLMSELRRVLEHKQVHIREGCEFRGVECDGNKVTSVQTSLGHFAADAVVIATGAWTPLLAKTIGKRLPIQPGKGYSITMSRPTVCPRIPMIFEEHRVAITPFASGYRIGSTMEFAGYDASLNPARLQLLRDGAKLYLHEPFGGEVVEEWQGWRPMTYDSKPIIGPAPGYANLFVAAGHGMLGVSTATATGKLVAEQVTGVAPHLDPRPYAVGRF